eukprot:403356459
MNLIPTFENIHEAYQSMKLPIIDNEILKHRKEQMIVMIINLLRVSPRVFHQQLENMKMKPDASRFGLKPRTMMFYASDIDHSMNLLQTLEPVQSLQIDQDLCRLCEEKFLRFSSSQSQFLKKNSSKVMNPHANPHYHSYKNNINNPNLIQNHNYHSQNSMLLNQSQSPINNGNSSNVSRFAYQLGNKKKTMNNIGSSDLGRNNDNYQTLQNVDNQSFVTGIEGNQNYQSNSQIAQDLQGQGDIQMNQIHPIKPKTIQDYNGVKELVVDFVCREDLLLTTLREFFEVFIASIKKDQVFHKDLLDKKYHHIGVCLQFDKHQNVGTVRLILAESTKESQNGLHQIRIDSPIQEEIVQENDLINYNTKNKINQTINNSNKKNHRKANSFIVQISPDKNSLAESQRFFGDD